MSIHCICGLPGDGKTFSMTKFALEGIRKGKPVFTNWPIPGAHKLEREWLMEYVFPPGSLIFIDEAGHWFNSWDNRPEKEIYFWFSIHRHLQNEVYLAVQHPKRLQKAIRELVDVFWWSKRFGSRSHPGYFKQTGYLSIEDFALKITDKDYTFQRRVWARRLVKRSYDHRYMRALFQDKAEVPLVEWVPGFRYRNIFQRFVCFGGGFVLRLKNRILGCNTE